MIFDIKLKEVIEYLKLNLKGKFDDDTTQAIATHILQNPTETVPFLTESFKKKLQKDLSITSSIIDPDIPFPPNKMANFKFIDLFAGIGGFRIPLQEIGGKCVFSSEWDKSAKKTYFQNFGEIPFGDIRDFTKKEFTNAQINKLIPDHDILAAGFPCQPFSHAGVSARQSVGKKHGFEDEIQGTLFFDIVRIVKAKKPKILLLENVRNLKSHDEGRTFNKIKDTVEKYLNYSFSFEIIDSSSLVPQRRKRCFMICYRDKGSTYQFPEITGEPLPLRSILEKSPPSKYTISDKLWAGHISRTKRNIERGTGFTAHTADLDKPSNTIVARYGKDGKECLIPQKGKNPRKLTPRECARLLGFPEDYLLPEYDSPAYKQFGNSVVVPVVKEIVKNLDI
ncbi:MAG: DNA (cytosine-5-)-methyltransferase [Bacteriovoracaceae bacterium]